MDKRAKYLYTRAYCRNCRLNFEYAVEEEELGEGVFVLCPRCGEPADYRPFQPCPYRRYERIEARYERLARPVEEKRVKTRKRKRPWKRVGD